MSYKYKLWGTSVFCSVAPIVPTASRKSYKLYSLSISLLADCETPKWVHNKWEMVDDFVLCNKKSIDRWNGQITWFSSFQWILKAEPVLTAAWLPEEQVDTTLASWSESTFSALFRKHCIGLCSMFPHFFHYGRQ
jgi:hypothetical protein